MARKKTKEEVDAVLECNYINNTSEIRMNCPVHGEWPTTLSVLKKGHGCPTCGDERIGDAHRLSTEEVQAVLDNFCISTAKGYTVLECNYTGINDRNIRMNCPVHGEWKTTMKIIQQGGSCKKCSYVQRTADMRARIEK